MIIKQYERAIILCGWASTPEAGRPRHPDEDTIRRHHILVVDIREKVREFKAERMLTKDDNNNNVPVTINRRNPALQDNRRACPRRDTERRKFQRNNPASGSDNAEKQHRLVGVSGHIYYTVQEGRGQAAHQVGYSKRGRQLGHRSDGRLDPAGDNPAGARSSDVDAGAGRQRGKRAQGSRTASQKSWSQSRLKRHPRCVH
jgi:hypothetical protein